MRKGIAITPEGDEASLTQAEWDEIYVLLNEAVLDALINGQEPTGEEELE